MDLAAIVRHMPYGSCPLPDVAGAGQLAPPHITEAARAGVRTIIDLRAANEPRGFDEAKAVRAEGMEYVLIPVTPETLDDAVYDRFLAVLRDPAKRPVIVKCATANRVGALLLPYLLLDEKLPEPRALEEAQRIGLRNPQYAAMGVDYARRHAAKG